MGHVAAVGGDVSRRDRVQCPHFYDIARQNKFLKIIAYFKPWYMIDQNRSRKFLKQLSLSRRINLLDRFI